VGRSFSAGAVRGRNARTAWYLNDELRALPCTLPPPEGGGSSTSNRPETFLKVHQKIKFTNVSVFINTFPYNLSGTATVSDKDKKS
jgi:hypothetical protein